MTSALLPSSLAELNSAVLTQRLGELYGEERQRLVDFLWHLAELDARRAFVAMGYPSTFAWCQQVLKMSDGSIWRRLASARLLRRFPVIDGYLRDGRLCMTTLVLLRDVLDEENHRELLEQAADHKEDEVKVLVATLRPRPEVADSIRRLPTPPIPVSKNVVEPSPLLFTALAPAAAPSTASAAAPGPKVEPTPEPARTSGREQAVNTSSTPLFIDPPRPRIEPIDATRHSVKFTAGPEFMSLFKEVKAALGHVVPDGNIEGLLRVCMQKTLELCARRQRAEVQKPEPKSTPREDAPTGGQPVEARMEARRKRWSRYVTAAVRRAVWQRDGGRCAFVGPDGRRCGSTHRLQLDHIRPHACGGEATVENLRLVCESHNLYLATQYFGEAHMARYTKRGLHESGAGTPSGSASDVPGGPSTPTSRSGKGPPA